ncbi:alpha/beta-hydrolase [Nemania sp. FL0916]|nr:alpha/beta-hydrolase [Nemania sp. FL0916]
MNSINSPVFAFGFGAKRPVALASTLLITAAAIGCIATSGLWQRPKSCTRHYDPSPSKTVDSQQLIRGLPYPPDALPGSRDVDTPYGSIRVYEWGPADGERVLFVHGISTPCIALGDLGHELVGRGYRVILFDLFGRGYSDGPNDLTYDTRLYVTQLLLVLASSGIPSTAAPGVHLVGYSLGGGLSVAFTRYFPHLVRSLCLVAPGGLIRPHHVGWLSWLYYTSGLLPEILVKYLVKRRIRPKAKPVHAASPSDLVAAEVERTVNRDGDASGGARFDGAAISKTRPHVTVSSLVVWQVDNHAGFVRAFLSTIRNAPIYAPQEDWQVLSKILEARRPESGPRTGGVRVPAGLETGKILVVLGKDDSVVIMSETVEDAYAVLGRDGVEFAILDGGHEIPFTSSPIVAKTMEAFWKSR